MTKNLSEYQYLEGEKETERDKLERGSKYWNDGKWNNFITPFLPINPTDKIFIDVGSNAGLFLKFAQDLKFKRVIGIEPHRGAYERSVLYRKKNKFNYEIIHDEIKNCIDDLPVADVTLLANVHYYFLIDDWFWYIKKLRSKTHYCIIVTAEKRPNAKYAPSDIDGIRNSFKGWEEVGIIDIQKDGTPHSRHLTGLCFKNPVLDRVPIDSLDNGNAQQRDFLKQLDQGIHYSRTDYYRRLKDYRKRTSSRQRIWSEDELDEYMNERIQLYHDVKNNGLKHPLKVRTKDMRIVDGNHRHEIIKYLGDISIIIEKV